MLTQNFGVANKENYGILWYSLEWSVGDSERGTSQLYLRVAWTSAFKKVFHISVALPAPNWKSCMHRNWHSLGVVWIFRHPTKDNKAFDQREFVNIKDKVWFSTRLPSFDILIKRYFYSGFLSCISWRFNLDKISRICLDTDEVETRRVTKRLGLSFWCFPFDPRVFSTRMITLDIGLSPLVSWSDGADLWRSMSQCFQ